MTFTTKWATQV